MLFQSESAPLPTAVAVSPKTLVALTRSIVSQSAVKLFCNGEAEACVGCSAQSVEYVEENMTGICGVVVGLCALNSTEVLVLVRARWSASCRSARGKCVYLYMIMPSVSSSRSSAASMSSYSATDWPAEYKLYSFAPAPTAIGPSIGVRLVNLQIKTKGGFVTAHFLERQG